MAKMVGEQSIPYGSGTFDRGVRQFEANLDALLSKYRDAGVPVVIGTLGSNVRDQRPFIYNEDDADNAVVASNERAISLWNSLGFEIVGTVPDAFRHPSNGPTAIHIMYRLL